MYSEDNLLPLSALQHMIFCERQCALIHIEQVWAENLLTAEGRIFHDRVHERGQKSRGNVMTEFGVPLRSLRLGLIGKSDVVEFHRVESNPQSEIENHKWLPFPVEYKRGKPKPDNCDQVQLCAQALCLEEMLDCEILQGALFYGKTRRRHDVHFDAALRKETEETAERVHELIRQGRIPKAVYIKKCKSCSLYEKCMPQKKSCYHSAKRYLANAMSETDGPENTK